MDFEIEKHILQNYSWARLPINIKEYLGDSQKEYEKCILDISIKNQLRHRGNIVQRVLRDEAAYYRQLVQYSRQHLMLYPYHLADVVVKGLRLSPFEYYVTILQAIMEQERSYDSLPNFTAADCLRLLGIGRNQYIELMNQCRSGLKQRIAFRKRSVRHLLPVKPVDVYIDPSWRVDVGLVMEEDVKLLSSEEKHLVDMLIDCKSQPVGQLDRELVHALYSKGLIYVDVPVRDDDRFSVPPLEGFVMNRVLGDYFEKLLYKIFVSIDEQTTVAELSAVLQIDLQLVKNAISVYCRLGFARKKASVPAEELHPSWRGVERQSAGAGDTLLSPAAAQADDDDDDPLIRELQEALSEQVLETPPATAAPPAPVGADEPTSPGHDGPRRIAFLFDSTLTAFLMMGNLSPGLKNHAVTMFEVGKLPDESIDSLLGELDKINTDESEGEAERYFLHAIALKCAIQVLRCQERLLGLPLDLVRCESLQSLDAPTCSRLLNKNYRLMVSMCPLSMESRALASPELPPHFGPAIPEVNSVWMKLYLYQLTGSGPPTFCFTKGTRLCRMPEPLVRFDRLLVTTWGHDPVVIAAGSALLTLNDALTHSALLVQGLGWSEEGEVLHVPFPLAADAQAPEEQPLPAVVHRLAARLQLSSTCGFVKLLRLRHPVGADADGGVKSVNFALEVPYRQPLPTRQVPVVPAVTTDLDTLAGETQMEESSESAAQSEGASVEAAQNNSMESRTVESAEASLSQQQNLDSVITEVGISSTSDPCEVADNEDQPVNGVRDPEAARLLSDAIHDVIDAADEVTGDDPEADARPTDGCESAEAAARSADSPAASSAGPQQEGPAAAATDDGWVLLDCCFGLPLFDIGLCRAVSRRVVDQQMFNEPCLQRLREFNCSLTEGLVKFMAHCQAAAEPEETSEGVPAVRLPTRCLAFTCTEVTTWQIT